MATIAQEQVTLAGLTPSYAGVTAADKFQPGANVYLQVKNASGSPCTVTVDSKVPSNYGDDTNVVVTVPATTGDKVIGPFPPQRFAGADGMADVTFSAQTSVTARAFRV